MTAARRRRMRAGVVAAGGLVVSLLGSASVVHAYRPFITEDAGVAGRGVAQLELSTDHLRWRSGGVEQSFLVVPIYGVTDALELAVETPFRIVMPEDRDTEAGPGDLTVAGKYRIVDETAVVPAFALRASVKTPSGSEPRGLGSGTWDFGVTAIATKTFEPVTLHAMVGYIAVADEDSRHRSVHTFGAAVDWVVARSLHLVAEVAGNGHPERRRGPDPMSALLGGIYDVTEKLAIDVGARLGFNEAVPRWTFTAGVTITF